MRVIEEGEMAKPGLPLRSMAGYHHPSGARREWLAVYRMPTKFQWLKPGKVLELAGLYLKPTRSSICCTLTWFMPTALMGMTSLLNSPPDIALSAGLSNFKPLTTGHSLLPLAK